MMCREAWTSLDGPWQFAHDDADVGLGEGWWEPARDDAFDRVIQVPFPPESPASGIDDSGFHPVVWYRRTIAHDELSAPEQAGDPGTARVLVHLGAVDHHARVWFDGQLVAEHEGGQTPFTADVTDVLRAGSRADGGAPEQHVLVVRAEDDPHALDQPRGKQDWREEPHGIWYDRSTGIWQSVWLEVVPALHVVDVAWTPDAPAATVRGEVTLSRTPSTPVVLDLVLRFGDEVLAEVSTVVRQAITQLDVAVPALRNGQDRDRLQWTPETPYLVDIEVVVRERAPGAVLDRVASYVGLRHVAVAGGLFTLNGHPCYTRSVLNQGFRPQTHLASRGSDELRAEVETILAMGFNSVRLHQKAEDPRFLYWADRLGLMVWSEVAGAYDFSPRAVALLTTEWLALVRRYRSHPSVVAWVPINESWGVQDIATVPAQQQLAQALVSLTRALDPSRPALSNEGWEHVDSDILGLHDYTVDPDELRSHYVDAAAVAATVSGFGPQGRRTMLSAEQVARFEAGGSPLMITEFGGISMAEEEGAWGYDHVSSTEEYAARLRGLYDALRASNAVVGSCYTQYMDTGQETNGLLFSDGTPKLPLEVIAEIVTGSVTDLVTAAPSSP